MTAIAGAAPAAPALGYENMSMDEVLDELDNVNAYLRENTPKIAAAQKAQAELKTMIGLLLEKDEARRFDNGRKRVWFEKRKTGSATVTEPEKLRSFLMSTGVVPLKVVDEVLPLKQPPPFVKPDLRKLRKVAEYGAVAAKAIAAHILEPSAFDVLMIEDVMIDVTPAE
jgi:hypothetical protein